MTWAQSERVEWDYLLWLEHAASVTESAGQQRDAVLLLDCALQYTSSFAASGDSLQRLLRHAVAAQLLNHSTSDADAETAVAAVDTEAQDDTTAQRVHSVLLQQASSAIRSVVESADTATVTRRSTSAALQLLSEVASVQDVASQCQHKSFAPFAMRCAKKSVTKMHNCVVTHMKTVSSELQTRILSRCALSYFVYRACSILTESLLLCFCSSSNAITDALATIRTTHSDSTTDTSSLEALALSESRIRRMLVTLAVLRLRESSASSTPSASLDDRVAFLAAQVARVRRLLDDAMADHDTTKRSTILQALLADVHAIARECYSCAAHFYKQQAVATTRAALTAAFALAESFLEYVMCDPTMSPAAVQRAHAELKADAIASLLAFCCHEGGDVQQARVCLGHAVLYASDAHVRAPEQAVDKYVAGVFDELQRAPSATAPAIAAQAMSADVAALVDNVVRAFDARGVGDALVRRLIQSFRRSFALAAAKVLERVRSRHSTDDAVTAEDRLSADEQMQVAVDCECHLAHVLLTRSERSEYERNALMLISQALSTRTRGYAAYYATLDGVAAIHELSQSHTLLSDAITALEESSSSSSHSNAVDLGAAYAWRGVLAMEIVLVSSYAAAGSDSLRLSEDDAIRDIGACVRHLETVTTDDARLLRSLFDVDALRRSLEAVCTSLSLISCPVLETAVRQLLAAFDASSVSPSDKGDVREASAWPPPSLALLNLHVDDASSVSHLTESSAVAQATEAPPLHQLQQIDAAIALGVKHHVMADHQSTVRHLQRAMTRLRALKAHRHGPGVSRVSVAKAIGMRELLVHLLLSDVHVANGHVRRAITDAKAALSICWKLSKKVAPSRERVEMMHFALPDDVTQCLSSARRPDGAASSASLLYFQALECASWDVLHAAKLVLCRIGTLYSLSGQPHRYVPSS